MRAKVSSGGNALVSGGNALVSGGVALLICTLLWVLGTTPLCLARSEDPASAPRVDASATIFVVRRGWHIDIGFACADMDAPLERVAAKFPGARYVFFGFGDRHYLLAKHRGASELSGALFPGPGLMLVTALKSSPAEAFGARSVMELSVTMPAFAAIESFVTRSLAAPNSPEPVAGPYAGSLYYGTPLRYSALHTCNTWVAQALQAGAVPVHSRRVWFAGQLWNQLEPLSRETRVPQASVPATPAP